MTPEGPRGMCLAQMERGHLGRVLSILVQTAYRNAGWGRRLLAETATALTVQGALGLAMTYTEGPATPALEAVLRHCGWQPPIVRMVTCKVYREDILRAPWMRDARLANGFTLFAWRDLTPAERQWIIDHEGAPGWHTPDLSPFKDEAHYDPITSIGLRWHGEIAGWLVTHRVVPDSVRYTNLFVRAEFRWKAPHLPMVAEVIHRQMRSPAHAAAQYGTFVQPASDAVHRFYNRRLKPFMTSAREVKSAWKPLS